MTSIHILCDKETNIVKGFEIFDHADYADKGYDIVCAAISAISITIQNAIEKQCDDAFCQEADPKKTSMKFLIKETPSHDAAVLLQAAVEGFRGIAEEYKENVRILIQEV